MALNSLPLASQIVSFTQQPIKDNFDGINAGFAVDHVELSALSPFTTGTTGQHKQVNLLRNGTPVLNIGGYGLYVDNAGFPGTTDTTNLHLIRIGHIDTPIVGPAAVSPTTDGWTYLPTGIIMQWGSILIDPASGGTPVTFPKKFPIECFNVQTTVQYSFVSSSVVFYI